MKTKSIISLLQEAEDAQNQVKTYLKDIQNEIEDDKKEIKELKEEIEELEEEAEENTTQLFLFHEFLRCSGQDLIFAKFVADLEEFGDVALNIHLIPKEPFMPDGDIFEDVA